MGSAPFFRPIDRGGGGGWADICDINIRESLPRFTYTVVAFNAAYSA